MPHLVIDHSANLDADMPAVCAQLADAMDATGIFPRAGTRVRAHAATAWVIADRREENAYCHMILRMGAGRDMDTKRRAGDAVMAAAQQIFAAHLAAQHFALSLEIVEIDAVLTWKQNAMAQRMQGDA